MLNHVKTATVWLALAAVGAGILVSAPVWAEEQAPRKITKKVPPVFSKIAQKARLTGTVKLTVVVSPEGIVKSISATGGNPLFVQSAQDAVKQWTFEAAATETTEAIAIKFERPL